MPKPFVAWIALSFFLLLGLSTIQAQTPSNAPNLKDPEALLAAAQASNGLAGDDLKPWHLQADYEVFDAYGKPLSTGTFEEWWAAKNKWKRSYTGSHYTGTEYHLPEGTAHEPEDWTPVPWPESLIATKLLFSPVPARKKNPAVFTDEKGAHAVQPPRLTIYPLPGSKPPLNCVVPAAQFGNQYPAAFGNYCFSQGSPDLRLSHVDSLDSIYNKLAQFQARIISLESEIACDHHPVIKLHVKSLAALSPEGGDPFIPTTPVNPTASGNGTVPIAGAVIAGKKLSGPTPEYPIAAKSNGEQGVVILSGRIDKQGSIANLEILESPSPLLSDSAMKAVLKWKYQPYLLNGSPVDVETTINVNFNLGR